MIEGNEVSNEREEAEMRKQILLKRNEVLKKGQGRREIREQEDEKRRKKDTRKRQNRAENFQHSLMNSSIQA